ncbi:hypothetical protein KAR91_25430 [Candidatus Pacearchaeota archaeon]|nr:hypothetical protein [Candidatus Pacearchaeota archaeon]
MRKYKTLILDSSTIKRLVGINEAMKAIFLRWLGSDFGELQEIKNSVLALTLIIVGIQTISSSFMLSILGIKAK